MLKHGGRNWATKSQHVNQQTGRSCMKNGWSLLSDQNLHPEKPKKRLDIHPFVRYTTNMRTRFSKQNTVVRCKNCGKLTHSSIDGCLDICLCRKCLDEAEAENTYNDTGTNPNCLCERERIYKGITITRLWPSGYYQFYSDAQQRFLTFDTLSGATAQINKEKT